jgi:tRNA-splicing ligase RtcB
MSSNRLNRAQLAHYLRQHDQDTLDADDPRAHLCVLPKQAKRERQALSGEPVQRSPLISLNASQGYPVTRAVSEGCPVNIWANEIEASAWAQIEQVARLPFLHPKGLSLMPDVHVGHGACVGSVLPMRGALVPSAVGVDIGCGMCAVRVDMHARELPDSLKAVRAAIEAAVPLGQAAHRDIADAQIWAPLHERYKALLVRHPKVFKRQAGQQLGTLGGGNHFIEVCLDEAQQVWVMLHSGSRGAGGLIGQHFIEQAAQWCDTEGFKTINRHLGFLPEGTALFDDYRQAVLWGQDYAQANRQVMLRLTLSAIAGALGRKIAITDEAIHCHHNYVSLERHFGEDLWITRKGAIRADAGRLGIIPGSMGTESFIVRGKGEALAYESCSHGAGRTMSRAAARASFTTKDLRRQTEGVECRKDKDVIDEAPGAYKPIREVMAQQRDLVDVVHTLRQIVCVKG